MTKLKNEALVTFIPKVTFTGYPDGVAEVFFEAGKESAPVSPDYLLLLKEKGLVADDQPTDDAVKA